MKTINLFFIIALGFLSFASFKTSETELSNDGYYAFIVVDGVYKNHTGYVSRILSYPGYDSCRRGSVSFFADARNAFSNYLKANHNDAFPYGENNNFSVISMKKHSTNDLLKTYAEAELRLTEWIADQKQKQYSVQTTNFSFSCN